MTEKPAGLWNHLPIAYVALPWHQASCRHPHAYRLMNLPQDYGYVASMVITCPDCKLNRISEIRRIPWPEEIYREVMKALDGAPVY
jgi:hypothetical protein